MSASRQGIHGREGRGRQQHKQQSVICHCLVQQDGRLFSLLVGPESKDSKSVWQHSGSTPFPRGCGTLPGLWTHHLCSVKLLTSTTCFLLTCQPPSILGLLYRECHAFSSCLQRQVCLPLPGRPPQHTSRVSLCLLPEAVGDTFLVPT